MPEMTIIRNGTSYFFTRENKEIIIEYLSHVKMTKTNLTVNLTVNSKERTFQFSKRNLKPT